MTLPECRRDRLAQVLDLARMYRGWTRQEVAVALGREPSKVIPESGNPKLDLVVGIARLLEWPVGEVAECLWGEPLFDDTPERAAAESGAARVAALWRASQRCRAGGRFQQAVDLLQMALIERSIPPGARTAVQAHLADAHLSLWHLAEARALASELLRPHARGARRGSPPSRPRPDPALALALAVRGHAHRRLLRTHPEAAHRHASAARADLVAGLATIDALLAAAPGMTDGGGAGLGAGRGSGADGGATDLLALPAESLLALANAARGAIVECDVELGALPPDVGVSQLLRGLDAVVDPESMAPDAMLATWGWWSVFGANIALAHFRGAVQQRYLAIFTNKALEIADRTGCWALRERAFMLEHLRRLNAKSPARRGNATDSGAGAAPEDGPTLLDHDDVRAIIGVMGRFSHFRQAGWALLRDAVILD